MAEWTLQHGSEIINGQAYKIYDYHLLDNFNGLKSDIDDRLSSIASSAQTVASPLTFNGACTFSASITHSNVVNSASTVNITGQLNLGRATDPTPNDGDLWYNTADDLLKIRLNGATYALAKDSDVKGFITGLKMSYASASTLTVGTGSCRDSANTSTIVVGSPLTLDITTTGAGGRDSGSESSNTHYFVYVIGKTDGTVNVLGSTSSTSPSMPTGYTLKRRIGSVRNDGSSNFIPFYQESGGEFRWTIYQVSFPGYNQTVGVTNKKDGGSDTSFTDVDLSSFVPSTSTLVRIKASGSNTAVAGIYNFRKNGATDNGYEFVTNNSVAEIFEAIFDIQTDSSQIIEYKVNAASSSSDIAVVGYFEEL